MKKRYYVLLILLLALVLFIVFSGFLKNVTNSIFLKHYWQENYSMIPPDNIDPDMSFNLVAKAQKDGCFFSVGNEKNYYNPHGIDVEECISKSGNPKANQSYLWCSTEEAGKLFYGTASNYLCQSFMNFSRNDSLRNDCMTCEWGFSEYGAENDLIGFYGDCRPPHAYVYDPETGENIDITPYDDKSLNNTLGFRSAGSINGIAFFAGPGISSKPGQTEGTKVFAYDAISNNYLGSVKLDSILLKYNLLPYNVRRCDCAQGSVYIGLAVKDLDDENKEIGVILKWTGNREDPFQFQLVGRIPEPVNEICLHKNRLYLHTWPAVSMADVKNDDIKLESVSAIYMGPEIPEEGLTDLHMNDWKKVWDYSQYEPDENTWKTYIGGKMISFNGHLYFGTFHMPFANFLLMKLRNEGASKWEMFNALVGTHRAISVFRCTDFSVQNPNVEIVFGMEELPVYDSEKKKWGTAPNKLNKQPLSGPMGIWNPFNHYTWSMEVMDGKLFIGTKSYFRKIPEMITAMGNGVTKRLQKRIDTSSFIHSKIVDINGLKVPADWLGGDLFYLTTDSNTPVKVTTDGFGNQYNYGMRCITRIGDKIYVGTANPYNLAEEGGFELIEVW